MSIEHAKVEFGDSNIINFKGYNDSGKSSMLRALDVLFYNIKPTMQTSFIQDEKDYFRVMGYFSDGVVLLRDKYSNGQSLYEMYKDGECIYTNKQGRQLTKVSGVPSVVADYLGLIADNGIYLNSRSCFDKQLLVQTTGSENYKFLNAVLRSEEIAIAGEYVNTDKNKMVADINSTEAEISVLSDSIKDTEGLTDNIVNGLKAVDSQLDINNAKIGVLDRLVKADSEIKSIPKLSKIDSIDMSALDLLARIQGVVSEKEKLKVPPEMSSISVDRLVQLSKIKELQSEINGVSIPPELVTLDNSVLSKLSELIGVSQEYMQVRSKLDSLEEQLQKDEVELVHLQEEMNKLGKNYVKCKNCGALVEVGKHED